MLEQILDAEEKVDRLNTEVIAQKEIDYVFEGKILEIYCRISMRVPKSMQQHMTKNAILSVVIPIHKKNPQNQLEEQKFYHGFGTIKKILIKSGDEFLTVSLQIDIVNPLERSQRQSIPLRGVQYWHKLAFRIKFDDS